MQGWPSGSGSALRFARRRAVAPRTTTATVLMQGALQPRLQDRRFCAIAMREMQRALVRRWRRRDDGLANHSLTGGPGADGPGPKPAVDFARRHRPERCPHRGLNRGEAAAWPWEPSATIVSRAKWLRDGNRAATPSSPMSNDALSRRPEKAKAIANRMHPFRAFRDCRRWREDARGTTRQVSTEAVTSVGYECSTR